MDELQKKKLCFTCFQPQTPGHKCTTGSGQFIEVFSDNYEYEGGMDEEGHNSDQEEAYETIVEEERQEENHPSPDKAIMEVLSPMPRYHTI